MKRPAIYELLGGETVRDVIALAGGLEADAYLEKITIGRIEDNMRHVVLDVDLGGVGLKEGFAVENGDVIRVYSVYAAAEQFVKLEGQIKYPGSFAFRKGMKVSGLLEGQLLIDSYLERANILRTYDDMTKRLIAVDLGAVLSGDTTANVELRERDVVTVYSLDQIRQVPRVTVEGEVRKENTIDLTQGMRLSDAIFMAGGLKKNAYKLYAEIARVGPNGYSDIIRADLMECLSKPGSGADLLLVEDDRVFSIGTSMSGHVLVLQPGELRPIAQSKDLGQHAIEGVNA